MNHTEGNFTGANGLNLFYQSWRANKNEKAIIVLVHGFGEHSGRYMNVVNHMVPLGYCIYSFDHRGHGRSDGEPGHIMSWAEFREDVKIFLSLVRESHPELPIILMGHSMGGLVALNYILSNPDEEIKTVIASAPLLAQPGISPVLIMISKILSKIWPGFSIDTKLDVNSISRDAAVIKAYKKDPLVHSRASARFGTELTATIEWTQSNAADFNKPLLMYHGESDSLVPLAGTKSFFDSVKNNEKEMHIYPGGFHEPHNDIDHQTVVHDLENWCKKFI